MAATTSAPDSPAQVHHNGSTALAGMEVIGLKTHDSQSGESDLSLIQGFWDEIGFPTPASRWWEQKSPIVSGVTPTAPPITEDDQWTRVSSKQKTKSTECHRRGWVMRPWKGNNAGGHHRRDHDDLPCPDQQDQKPKPRGKGMAAQGQQTEKLDQTTDGGQPHPTVQATKAKKPRPPHCHQCKTSGHIAQVCKADIDCYVCNKKESHLAVKCPLLKLPKPTCSLFGFGKTEFGFIQISDFGMNVQEASLVPTALVSIRGGSLTPEIVQTELAHRIRPDWKWEAVLHAENSFLVAFPSIEELKRMDDVEFRLKNHGVSMTIIEWKTTDELIPAYELDEVWVHVSGVPSPWHHYLAFWALGCVIGATQEVDMLTYRRTGVIRVKISEVDFMDHDGDAQEDHENSSKDGSHDQAHKRAKNSASPTISKEQKSDVTAMQLVLTPFGNCRPPPPPRLVIANGIAYTIVHTKSGATVVGEVITAAEKVDEIYLSQPVDSPTPDQPCLLPPELERWSLLSSQPAAAAKITGEASLAATTAALSLAVPQMATPTSTDVNRSKDQLSKTSSTPRCRSVRSNVENMDGIAAGDDDSLLKAMKRKALRNLDDSFVGREVSATNS
ncbi:hypothetical protein OsJ_32978 [Oryza sativa Japonica Group]|uniref:DUF4283 domain-containing protein n=1 Tax=Oryza sativa subsp. japonica TaxID=39947 RepID=B9G9F3_ORYSJ|nr:hypothetical protein OsJ_32978 [Oryza sativa Japonica Group]